MISSQKIGERVAAARKRAGMTQAQLAERLGVSRPTLIAVEKGERRLSNEEIVKLAGSLAVEVNDLLREHAVVGEISPRFKARAHTPEVERGVERLRQLGAWCAELESLLGITRAVAPLDFIEAFRQARGGETAPEAAGCEAASLVRRTLGLGDGPVLGLEDKLELEAGFRVFSLPLDPSIAALFIWGEELGPCVGLSASHSHARRRLSLAHELGHFLRDPEAGDVLLAAPQKSRDATEVFCDAFARELLMPAEGLRRRVSQRRRSRGGRLTFTDLLAYANAYEISFQAMSLRLEALGCIERGTFAGLEKQGRGSRAAEKESEYLPESIQPDCFSERYFQLAFEAYDAALLSETELMRFLGCNRLAVRSLYLERRLTGADDGRVLELDLAAPVGGENKAP